MTPPEALTGKQMMEREAALLEALIADYNRIKAANKELLEALKLIADVDLSGADDRSKAMIAEYLVPQARAAIKKHGEKA